MESTFGMACNNFSIIAADTSVIHSILVLKNDEQKIFEIGEKVAASVVGAPGDAAQFAEYIAKNVQLYKMRNGYSLSPKAVAHFTRNNLADFLRSSTPYQVNLLLAGYDDRTGGELHFIDYLASAQPVPFGAHGYGGLMVTSILQRFHKPDLTIDAAYQILEKCVAEIQKRNVINTEKFSVVRVDKNGITKMDPISTESLVRKQPHPSSQIAAF